MWNHLIVVPVEIGTGTGSGTGISHARVTRPPTTKVTRRPVATPAWRVARRVLERGRRDDRRRGGRTDEGGGSERGRRLDAGWKATERARSGREGAVRRVESYRRKERSVPTVPLHPRIKNRSASPICTLSPQPRRYAVPAYPRGMLRSLRNTDTVHYRHRNTHSALIQTDNAPRRIVHRELRRKQIENPWK